MASYFLVWCFCLKGELFEGQIGFKTRQECIEARDVLLSDPMIESFAGTSLRCVKKKRK